MRVMFIALLAVACSSLRHVDPQPRNLHHAALATVQIEYRCAATDPFPGPSEFRPNPSTSFSAHYETGTVISERHVLSALHAFDKPCPWIPQITAWVGDRPLRMYIERRDRDPDGLVRIAVISGSTFGLDIAPPVLGTSDGTTYRVSSLHGTYAGDRSELARHFRSGDGGSGVYTPAGELVGLLLGTDEYGGIRIARVDASWLKGT